MGISYLSLVPRKISMQTLVRKPLLRHCSTGGTPWRNQAFAVTIMLLKGLKAFGIDGFGNDWLKLRLGNARCLMKVAYV